jgi:hypothetical protein
MPGIDYAPAVGQGTIAAGSTSTTINVKIKGDATIEGDEHIMVVLTPVTPLPILKNVGFGRIIDDDPPVGAGISISDQTLVEGKSGNRSLRFTVSRARRKAYPVTVSYTTQNGTATAGSDYKAVSGKVTIPADAATASITVPIKPDATKEPDETFTVVLSASTHGAIYKSIGTATILNDD